MNEMIERVAKAIHEEGGSLDMGGSLPPDDVKDLCREMARAAIGAMREPTEAMIEPGALAGELYGNTNAKATWQAMIDEALK